MKLVILDANSLGEGLDLTGFKAFGELNIYGFTTVDEVEERIKDVEVIITNKINLNAEILGKAKRLKLICLTATGSNNVDKVFAKNQGITVCNIVGYSTESVAQHTFTLLLTLIENMTYYQQYVCSGEYIEDYAFKHFQKQFHELSGKTFGIIGLGNIGQKVAQLATAFGCKIIYTSRSEKNPEWGYERTSLEQLLKSSDIVSIHTPLTEETKDMIQYEDLLKMKPTAILMNLGRGGIVNEQAIMRALEENLIGGFALDVLEQEPMSKNSPLCDFLHHPKLLITPHVAWASVESRNRMVEEVRLNIEAFIQCAPRNVVQ